MLFNSKKKKLKIVLLGPVGSGKTTLLYYAQLHATVPTVPTADFYTEDLLIETESTRKKEELSVCDVGGPMTDLWLGTTTTADGLIYVLDATVDHEQLDVAGTQFEHAITCRKTDGVPLLVFCNKSDCANCKSVPEIQKALKLENFHRRWKIIACSGTTGMNVDEGFRWIMEQAQQHKKELKSKKISHRTRRLSL